MSTLRFYKHRHTDGTVKEINYDEALDMLLTVYKDSDMTRDFLTIPNRIRISSFSDIVVKDDRGNGEIVCLMAGYYNALPDGVQYDDNCNRI